MHFKYNIRYTCNSRITAIGFQDGCLIISVTPNQLLDTNSHGLNFLFSVPIFFILPIMFSLIYGLYNLKRFCL